MLYALDYKNGYEHTQYLIDEGDEFGDYRYKDDVLSVTANINSMALDHYPFINYFSIKQQSNRAIIRALPMNDTSYKPFSNSSGNNTSTHGGG